MVSTSSLVSTAGTDAALETSVRLEMRSEGGRDRAGPTVTAVSRASSLISDMSERPRPTRTRTP